MGLSCHALPCLPCRKKANVDDVVNELSGKGLKVKGCACHVGNKEQLKQLVQATIQASDFHPALSRFCTHAWLVQSLLNNAGLTELA